MNKHLITATSKTDTHLIFDIKVSVPLEEVSEELTNDILQMHDAPFRCGIPVEHHINFFTGDDGKEKFRVSVEQV